MTDHPYTEADVERVTQAIFEVERANGLAFRSNEVHQRDAVAALDALAAAGRLLPEGASREVWLIGTDYMDDEVFAVVATRDEVDAMRERVSDRSDLSLNAVRYPVPYPSSSQDPTGGSSDG